MMEPLYDTMVFHMAQSVVLTGFKSRGDVFYDGFSDWRTQKISCAHSYSERVSRVARNTYS